MKNKELLSDYELDSMWMSYRYCIGRHTIASHMRAGDIASHCYGRISDERSVFTAYDINREIENSMMRGCGPNFWFPVTSMNRIYTSALDIFCQFVEDYNIQTKEDLLKYKEVNVKLADNERGYSLEVTTWEEWLRPRVLELLRDFYHNDVMLEDYAWKHFNLWLDGEDFGVLNEHFSKLTQGMHTKDNFYMTNVDDLMVWNDLVHLFDLEHHYWVELSDGTKVECFDTYINKTEQKEDGYLYDVFGYRKIRVPVNQWNGSITTYIPDEYIKNFNVDPDNI